MAAFTIVTALAGAAGASTTVLAGGGESGASLQAWGDNAYGEIGHGVRNGEPVRSPVEVQGVACATSAVATYDDSYAVLADGHVAAWGADSTLRGLGDGDPGNVEYSYTPVEVPGISTARRVVADGQDAYVLLANGTVDGWGSNQDGQFGNGKAGEETDTPGAGIGGFAGGVQAMAASNGTELALLAGGEVKSWGYNSVGQLGNGTEGFSEPTPGFVKNATDSGELQHIKAVGEGSVFSVALTTGGEVVAWGGNAVTGLGAGNVHYHSVLPVTVEDTAGDGNPLKGVTAIAVGANFVLALLENKTVVAWGYDALGQLGNGEHPVETFYHPIAVPGLTEVVSIVATQEDGYARLANGTVWAWGNNTQGEVGNGSTETPIDTPTQITALGDETTGLSEGADGQHGIALGPVANCTNTSTSTSTSSTSTSTSSTTTTSTSTSTSPNSPPSNTNPNSPPTLNGNTGTPGANPSQASAASGAVLATELGLASATACVSHRSFTIHIHQPAGYPKIVSAEVLLNHKQVGTVKGKRITSQVVLRGLPEGTFTILIRAHLAGGRTITGTRTYHTCAKHRLKGHHHKL